MTIPNDSATLPNDPDGDWEWLRALDGRTVARMHRFGRHEETPLLARLARLFLDVVPAELADLHWALAERDAAKLARVAHALKGGWEMAGALRFARLCARLEARAESGDVEACGRDLDALEKEYIQVAADFRDILSAAGLPYGTVIRIPTYGRW